ncbi:MAG: Bcr/CflA family efflux MFS transporter [Pseudomonadota bacterium]|uniref:Bcr/CflA family efflux MFS transporter n=1 Tax=Polaromonas sp. TaxID=1869339 RepID=UPI0025CE1105|nr:Bcr/CflA family efflux MFS transporter [Polaromonas sp.]MDQ3272153.1 Bcr/CflA family efflux MFS transporter [Pseudomonadota bacterium]
MSPTLVVLVLTLLLGIQPITTDLYLPALPALTSGFGANMAQAQLTLTALLLAFGVSQLFWGPLSDRFGRRPILLLGLSAYVVAAIGSAFAPSMALLIIWRMVQGAAMGAAVMCARAIVRDLYTPMAGARAMSRGLTGLGVIACLSAPLGGLLSDVFNWRIALLALAVFGAGALTLIALRFRESVAQKNPQALQPRMLLQTWWTILRNPTFVAFSALSTASYGGLFTFLAASSFVFIGVLGLSKTEYGLVMFSMSLVYVCGTFWCRRLLPRFGVRRSVSIAAVLTLSGGLLIGVLAWAGLHNVWALLLPCYLFIFAHGVHQPCSQSGAIGPFPGAAGAASALNGFLMMLAAFAMGGWLGSHLDGTVFPLAYGVMFWSICIALIAWTLVRRHGDPAIVAASAPL